MIGGFWLTVKCQFNSDTDCWYVALGVLAIRTDTVLAIAYQGRAHSSEGHSPWREGEGDTAMGGEGHSHQGEGDTALGGGGTAG